MKRVLNVKKVTMQDLSYKWGIPLPRNWAPNVYIRCNAKGIVNWEKAEVYQPDNLIERGNYKVH